MVVNARNVGFSGLQADPAADGVSDGFGLLKDFFEHEVVVSPFFQGGNFHFNGVHFRSHNSVPNGADDQLSTPVHRGDLFVFQVDDIFGVSHDGCGV